MSSLAVRKAHKVCTVLSLNVVHAQGKVVDGKAACILDRAWIQRLRPPYVVFKTALQASTMIRNVSCHLCEVLCEPVLCFSKNQPFTVLHEKLLVMF